MAPSWTSWFGERPSAVAEAWQDYLATYSWFLGLQILDLLTTLWVLALGGGESNPAAAQAMESNGRSSLLGLKVVLLLGTLVVWLPAMSYLQRRPATTRRWAVPVVEGLVVAATVVYAAVVFHNLVNLHLLLERAEG